MDGQLNRMITETPDAELEYINLYIAILRGTWLWIEDDPTRDRREL